MNRLKKTTWLGLAVLLGATLGLAQQAPMKRATASPEVVKPLPPGQVKLLGDDFNSMAPVGFAHRAELNRDYMVSLKNENLLQNYYLEAGMWNPQFRQTAMGPDSRGDNIHWGWESPTCQLKGHFLGHWLSAAAYLSAQGDTEVKAKADKIISELALIQKANGGQWVGSIPEKYFYWIAQGKRVWAPHYTVHKTFMGLIDMYKVAGNKQALEIANNWAKWFHTWTSQYSREQMDNILDFETGGMLEVWADLYGITGDPMYSDLIQKYRRGRLFDPLLAGKDPLTNRHANTTIPELQGAARVYEVTGDPEWRKIVEAYWKSAVTDRGFYCTGGQTDGEIWTPPHEFATRLGDKNQEHCVVYNMIRLADYLYRWTGDIQYADYIERNIHNGILAQQNPRTGMIAYFLPLRAGGHKVWGSPTNDFWCCHGSLVQAQTRHDRYVYYTDKDGVIVDQYIPTEANLDWNGAKVKISQRFDPETSAYVRLGITDPTRRPNRWVVTMNVESDKPAEMTLRVRLPWWLAGDAEIYVNDQKQSIASKPSSYVSLKRTWSKDTIRLVLPKKLTLEPLPDRPDTVAFMDGPVVLAGLTDMERTLVGDKSKPESILAPDNEREWATWLAGYKTVGQDVNVRFVPISEITDEMYTVYFPVRARN
jgi:uncharacterized protein